MIKAHIHFYCKRFQSSVIFSPINVHELSPDITFVMRKYGLFEVRSLSVSRLKPMLVAHTLIRWSECISKAVTK